MTTHYDKELSDPQYYWCQAWETLNTTGKKNGREIRELDSNHISLLNHCVTFAQFISPFWSEVLACIPWRGWNKWLLGFPPHPSTYSILLSFTKMGFVFSCLPPFSINRVSYEFLFLVVFHTALVLFFKLSAIQTKFAIYKIISKGAT